ncbi:MAG TPA: SRPBCC domain-containing protein [Rhizomicrobium sp.]|nr:SRPBCC domain-containing protein [Rhizomicrobium sp.]
MSGTRFVYVTIIRSTREKIWDALTKPEFTRQYWAGTTQKSGWKKGDTWGAYTPDDRLWDTGEILESDYPSKLVLTWKNLHFPEMTAEGFTTLTYVLEGDPLGIKLTLTHEIGVENSKIIGATSQGWPSVLASLKTLLETGTPLSNSDKWPEGL